MTSDGRDVDAATSIDEAIALTSQLPHDPVTHEHCSHVEGPFFHGTKQPLAVGDHVFLRPQQSEFVFLQFGDIAVYEQGRIVDTWPVFPQAPMAQPAQA